MPRLRVVASLSLLVLVVGASPGGAAPMRTGWVHWQGKHFSVWVPSTSWTVVESPNTLSVGSPTGLATVEFAHSVGDPYLYSIDAIVSQLLSRAGGVSGARVTSRGARFSLPDGVGQTFGFTATRLRDGRAVRGLLTAETFSDAYGGYAHAAYEQAAPASRWSTWAATLKAIQKGIVFYG